MNKFLKHLFFSVLLVMFVSCLGYANDLTDDYFDIAQNYYKEGNNDKAMEYVNQILKIENNNQQAIGLKIKLTPPNSEKTIPNINKPLIFNTPYKPTGNELSNNYYNQGLLLYQNKNYSEAETKLKAAIQADSNNFQAYNTLGLIYFAQNKILSAKNAFIKSNELNIVYTIPLDNLSQVYNHIGDKGKCYETLLKAQTSNSHDFCAYILLGEYYRESQDFDNAIKHYQEAIKINPKYYNAYLKIAQTRTDNMDFSGAINTLKYYSSLKPNDDITYYLMAKNYTCMNEFGKARENIYKAILMNNCKEYRIELGKINYLNDDIEDALANFTSTVDENTSAEIYNYIGMCYYNLHDFQKAINNIEKSLSMPEKRILYYYNLAKIYYTLKDNTNYAKYMEVVKNYKPVNCQDYIDMSGILLDSEDKNSAIAILDKGISKFPKVKELYLEKLKIYDLTNDAQGIAQTKLEMENSFR